MNQKTPAAPEEMASFFDVRAEGYDEHMFEEVYKGELDMFYEQVTSPIAATAEPVRILDLGCGTGLEVPWIFQKAPKAIVTGVDMSAGMLDLLRQKHPQHSDRLHLIQGSYTEIPFKQGEYDYALSVMTVHHLLEDAKLDLYRKIRSALKDGGLYIEGDYVENEDEARRLLKEYYDTIQHVEPGELYHLDIPCTVEQQERLFAGAEFREVNTIHHVGSRAIFVARK